MSKRNRVEYGSTSQIWWETKANRRLAMATQDKKTRIRAWLMQDGWRVEEINAPDALWLIQAYETTSRPILIGQPKRHADAIIIQGDAGFVEEFDKHFGLMRDRERQEFLWDLRFGLLSMGVEARGIEEPLHEIQIHIRIFDDGLTKDEFFSRLSKLKIALDYLELMCERRVLHAHRDSDSAESVN